MQTLMIFSGSLDLEGPSKSSLLVVKLIEKNNAKPLFRCEDISLQTSKFHSQFSHYSLPCNMMIHKWNHAAGVTGGLKQLVLRLVIEMIHALKQYEQIISCRYEDMKRDLPAALRQIGSFLGKPLTDENIATLANHVR